MTLNQPSESSPTVSSLVFAKGLVMAWAALGVSAEKKKISVPQFFNWEKSISFF